MAWKNRRSMLEGIAEGLVKAGALQFGTFTLADGRDSSYFVNLRELPSYPGVFRTAVDSMTKLAKTKAPKANALCTAPISGLAYASPIALALRKPLIYTRSAKRVNYRRVEGELRPGWDVLLVDDLSATGKTMLATAEAVREEGGQVKHALVLIDRSEGARERLHAEGITLHHVTDVLELADVLLAMELIGKDDFKRMTKAVGGR